MVPNGFKPLERTSPVIEMIGPVYARGEGAGLVLAVRAERKHCNTRGTVHGGILATLADIALGYACVAASEDGQSRNFVTIDLAVEYLAATQAGDWLYSEVKVM
ncbi:MAG TPA: PaaI family thioesterase, partial [Burkholderiales bacterium]